MSRYRVVIQAMVTTTVEVEAESIEDAADRAEVEGPRYLLDENNKYMTMGDWEADLDDTEVLA